MSLRDLQRRFDDRDDELKRAEEKVTREARYYRRNPSITVHRLVALAVRELLRLQGGRP